LQLQVFELLAGERFGVLGKVSRHGRLPPINFKLGIVIINDILIPYL
jgi:hypothetical protein